MVILDCLLILVKVTFCFLLFNNQNVIRCNFITKLHLSLWVFGRRPDKTGYESKRQTKGSAFKMKER